MPRITRSISKSNKGKERDFHNEESRAESETASYEDEQEKGMELHFGHLQQGVKQMQQEIKKLKRSKQEIRDELESLKLLLKSNSPRKTRPNSVDDSKRIMELQNTVKELQKINKRNQRQIEKLRAKELKAEAEELQEQPHDGEVGDAAHRMRKLLRKFNDLMLVTTLADDGEDCPICFERMKLKQCSSMPCQHLVCNECLPRISEGADEIVNCPQCRESCPRDDIDLVHYAESERWDALLEVAQAWAAFDHRGEQETSEEEEEEFFLTDGNGSSEIFSQHASSQEEEDVEEATRSSEVPTEARSTPLRGDSPLPYSQSPAQAKRKRLQELAEEREKKKRR
ncbi:hypothetical protein BDQ12DRAFT_675481 [Crucibulum laeve]|uniref:RING-type domain-containing protein n=1 Tax=Crucibulum laeve TaxID=68775 RepID=A0A5C3MIH8_9AGAR|nr:hypothetical protein BDQ12DRAFT_675481 [Crucibulum laeve]